MKEKIISLFKAYCENPVARIRRQREYDSVIVGDLFIGIARRTFSHTNGESFTKFSIVVRHLISNAEKHQPISEKEYDELRKLLYAGIRKRMMKKEDMNKLSVIELEIKICSEFEKIL